MVKQNELHQVQYEVDRYRETAQQLHAEVVPLTARKRELEAAVLQQEAAVTKLQSKTQALVAGVAGTTGPAQQIEQTAASLAKLNEQLSDLNAEIAVHATRESELKNEFEEIEALTPKSSNAKPDVLSPGLEEMHRRQQTSSKLLEVQKQELIKLQSQMSQLQEAPGMELCLVRAAVWPQCLMNESRWPLLQLRTG